MDVRSSDKYPKEIPKASSNSDDKRVQNKEKPKNPFSSLAPQVAFGEVFSQHLIREPAREESRQNQEGYSDEGSERDGLEEYSRDSDSGSSRLDGSGSSSKKQKVLGKKDLGEGGHGGGGSSGHGGGNEHGNSSEFAEGRFSGLRAAGLEGANSFSTQANQQQMMAQRALETMEELSQAQSSVKPLPPEVFKSLVSSISRFWDKNQEVLHLQLHEEALGGALGIKLFKDSEGVTQVQFEGDEGVLSTLETHQADLLKALRRPGRLVNLRFV